MISIYLDPALNKWLSQVKFSMEYMLNISGFSFKYLEENTELKPNDVILYYSPEYPKDDYAKWMIENHTFIYIPFVKDFYVPGTYNGDTLKSYIDILKYSIELPFISAKRLTGNPILIHGQNKNKYCKYEFDIIGNIFFHMSDDERDHLKNKDKSNNYHLEELGFYEYFYIPYVNHYIDGFSKIIIELMENKSQWQIKRCLWPNNQLFAAIISHNVDKLEKWNVGSIIANFWETFIHILKFRIGLNFRNTFGILRIIFTNDEDYWNFDTINRIIKKYKFRSTWFFSIDIEKKKNRLDYDIAESELLKEIQGIVKNGSEIALLNQSKDKSKETLSSELNGLLNITKTQKTGIRHTDCFGDIERLDTVHAELGLKYSSTRKIREKNAFYNGFTTPYPVYINNAGLEGKFPYEIPVVFSDKHLMVKKYKPLSFTDAMKAVKECIQKVKDVKGLFHISFTNSLFHDINYMPRLLEYIVDDVKNHNSFVGTCSEIIDWLHKRDQIEVLEEKNKIIIRFSEHIDQITFEVIGTYRILNVLGGNASFKRNTVQFINVTPGLEVEVVLIEGDQISE